MRSNPEHLKKKYMAIQQAYAVLDKRDSRNRPIYTYTNKVAQLAEMYYLSEKRIMDILVLDIEQWWDQRQRRRGRNK